MSETKGTMDYDLEYELRRAGGKALRILTQLERVGREFPGFTITSSGASEGALNRWTAVIPETAPCGHTIFVDDDLSEVMIAIYLWAGWWRGVGAEVFVPSVRVTEAHDA